MQVTGHHSDERLVACFGIAHTEEFEQSPDAVLVAVGVLAAKATNGIELVGFKVSCASVQCVSMRLHPWTDHVVPARTQRRLVKPPRFECRDDRILRRLGDQNFVAVIANAV